MGIPNIQDEAHVANAAQAFKFLADQRDPTICLTALNQLSQTVAKRARYLDANNLEDLTTFLNQAPRVGEGKAGDVHSIWSAVRDSLANTGAILKVLPDSATLHTERRPIGWNQRKLACQLLKEGVGSHRLACIKQNRDQGRAFNSISLHLDYTFFTYTGAFLSFPQYRFIHKARLNLLPVRTVQACCRQLVASMQCCLCGLVPETLAHVLNHYHHNLGLVLARHNSILEGSSRNVGGENERTSHSGDDRKQLS